MILRGITIYYILHAIHKNAPRLKRADFRGREHREDEYSTSVISIQMRKTGGHISIKSRYNDTIDNPDNTFFSNPDKIVPGLSAAISKYFNVDFSSHNVELGRGFISKDGRIIKYHYLLRDNDDNGIFFGSNFWMPEKGEIHEINPRRQIMMGPSVFDIALRQPVGPELKNGDSFADVFGHEIAGKQIQIAKGGRGGTKISTDDGTWVEIVEGNIVAAHLPNVTDVPDNFLREAGWLEYLGVPNLRTAGRHFLYGAKSLKLIVAPKLEQVGDCSMWFCETIESLDMPNLRTVGSCFLGMNNRMLRLDLPKLVHIGDNFMMINECLANIHLPMVEQIGNEFMVSNQSMTHINLPNVRVIGDDFMCMSGVLTHFYAKKLERIGRDAMQGAPLVYAFVPKLAKEGNGCLEKNPRFCGLRDAGAKTSGAAREYGAGRQTVDAKTASIGAIVGALAMQNMGNGNDA